MRSSARRKRTRPAFHFCSLRTRNAPSFTRISSSPRGSPSPSNPRIRARMSAKLLHSINEAVELHFANKLLFRYVYAPQFDPFESRKPYMHPICTLAGNEITCFRPHDHVWHKGVQMTMAHLSGQNFWGGFSYVRDQGYVKLENVGSMQ